jgi:thiamine-phosphate pyrophosphorylase
MNCNRNEHREPKENRSLSSLRSLRFQNKNMKLVVISPERDDSREPAILGELFAAGLEHYHVRKPSWSREKLEAWLRALPQEFRTRLVLHQHHELVDALGLGGVHERDELVGRGVPAEPSRLRSAGDVSISSSAKSTTAQPEASPYPTYPLTSRSCHDLARLRAALGRYDSVFFSPVFTSISKPGHGPRPDFPFVALAALLATRTSEERRTTILALGGITTETAPRALALGFDGVAVLGAIWQAPDPVAAFVTLRASVRATRPPNVAHTRAPTDSCHAA